MKRTNVKNGLKQRLNEIIGTDYGSEGAVPGITPWSVQDAMLENTRRVVQGIVGGAGSSGRPMKGLWLTMGPLILGVSGSFSISEGIGFTGNGDIIIFDSSISIAVSPGSSGTRYIYLKHEMAEVDGDIYETGKKTSFIGEPGQKNIVYDSKSINSNASTKQSLIVQSSSQINDGDHVLVGTVNVVGGVAINSASPTDVRGFAPNQDSGNGMLVPSLKTSEDVDVGGDLNVDGATNTNAINADGDITVTSGSKIVLPNTENSMDAGGGDLGITESIPSSFTSITVKNGIITGYS